MKTKLSVALLVVAASASLGAATVRIVQTNAAGDSVMLIDPATNKVVAEISGIEVNHGAAAAPDGSRLYVTNEAESTLDVVDLKTLKIVKNIPLTNHPNNVAVSRDGKRVYTAIVQGAGAVDVIDATTLTRVKSIRTDGGIHNVYVTPDGRFVVAGSIPGRKRHRSEDRGDPLDAADRRRRAADGVRDERRRVDEADSRPAVELKRVRHG
jgi:YVTN family beta-propeller protein